MLKEDDEGWVKVSRAGSYWTVEKLRHWIEREINGVVPDYDNASKIWHIQNGNIVNKSTPDTLTIKADTEKHALAIAKKYYDPHTFAREVPRDLAPDCLQWLYRKAL